MNAKLIKRSALGLFASGSLLISACTAPPKYVESSPLHPEGTLLIGEITLTLDRDAILQRYGEADLKAAHWSKADVEEGAAVILTNFAQSNPTRFGVQSGEFHVLSALIPKNSFRSPGSETKRTYSPGDAVILKVVRSNSKEWIPDGLHFVEGMVEPATAHGDCVYEDRGANRPINWRRALMSKKLKTQGWVWMGDEFVKPPPSPSK